MKSQKLKELSAPIAVMRELPGDSKKKTVCIMIGTDCIGSYKSNYHTITVTRVPFIQVRYMKQECVEGMLDQQTDKLQT
jgi:serine protease inhibitor ecotin